MLDAGAAALTAAAVLQRYAYGAYGQDLGLPTDLKTDVRYVGQMIDTLTGLSFNRARWYDRAAGRFTQVDSWGGDLENPVTLNKYLYGNANPANATDPTGQFSLTEMLVVQGGAQRVADLQKGYKQTKGAAETAKFLVRIALLQMELLSSQSILSKPERLLQGGYYAWEWFRFERRVRNRGVASLGKDGKLVGALADLPKYVASLPGAAEKLKKADRTPLEVGFLDGLSDADIDKTTFIPLTGTYKSDNFMAWGMTSGLGILKLLADIVEETTTGGTAWISKTSGAAEKLALGNRSLMSFYRIGWSGVGAGVTWHHHEFMGVMQLIKRPAHKSPHTGAVKFWEIITGEEYKSL